MPLTVYQAAPDGEFVGALVLDESDRDPLDPESFLIPGGCTATPPPAVGPGYVAVLRGGEWAAAEDHRGEIVYVDGIAVAVSTLGPLPEGATREPPPPSADDAWAALRAERDTRLAAALAVLDRHRNQADFGLPTTLSAAQAKAWAVYAQALRNLPETVADPAAPDWPLPPQ